MTTAHPHFPSRKPYLSWLRSQAGVGAAGASRDNPRSALEKESKEFEVYIDRIQPVGGRPKRLLDLVIAITALIVLLPLMILVASLIKIRMGGPVLYAHPRVGFNGNTFRCFKFRTMVPNPEEKLLEYLVSHPDAAQEWRERRKLRNDPRVTALGRELRRASLDELPQLLNVLRGEMSCVGPRPIVAAEIQRYGPTAKEYLSTRPGLTGLWQVSGRSKLTYEQRVAMDREYVRSWSLGLDLRILLKTIPAILTFEDAA